MAAGEQQERSMKRLAGASEVSGTLGPTRFR
jgi:hypothetical protein